MKRSPAALWLLLGYAFFVVYGSLVPLDWRPIPWDVAWERFQHIPFYKLGLESRADWVANGVLYVPLTLLATRVAMERRLAGPLAATLAVAMGWVLAVAVEFTQLHFPPRTVSLNDIVAECIGSVLGAVAALFLSRWVDRLGAAWAAGGARLAPRLLELYAGAYLLLCWFPYDLLLSAAEIDGKWRSGAWGWVLAAHERGAAYAALQLAVEFALSAPIGLMLARRAAAGRIGAPVALGWGFALGLVIEVGQFFVSSGVSQGASVASRAAGVWAGAALAPWLQTVGLRGLRSALGQVAPLLWCAYLPLLCFASGLLRGAWHGLAGAAESWAALRLLPFYYHYYTTEAIAVFSLGSVALMYAPAAVLGWSRRWSLPVTLGVVGLMALVVETAKLFATGLHADPTNVLIALATAFVLLRLLAMAERAPAAASAAPAAAASAADAVRGTGTGTGGGNASSGAPLGSGWLLALPAAAAWLVAFPTARGLLLAVLAAATVAVWRRPAWALALVPAALPVLDLAPWSGRLYLDEFDALFAVAVGVALHRTTAGPARAAGRLGPATVAWMLFALSLALSTLRGWWPLQWPDDGALAGYYSSWNALRIAKGAAQAALYLLLWRRLAAKAEDRCERALTTGMALGLAGCVAVMLWERAVFASLWDFAAQVRVTGPFSAMHKGGAYVECWLAVGAAFVLVAALRARATWQRVLAAVLLAAASYAMMVTYSRNGYAALAVVLVLGLATGLPWRRAAPARWAWGALAAAVVLAASLPVLLGDYARERLSQSGGDLALRQAHWADGLALRDGSLATAVLGMGVGRFPEAHFWRSAEPRHAASVQLQGAAGQRFLRLGQGATLYLDQVLGDAPFGAWKLTVEARAAQPGTLQVMVCEKWTLTSRNCAQAAVPVGPPQPGTAWTRTEQRLDPTPVLSARQPWGAPLKFSLLTPEQGVVEVARVGLAGPSGEPLLVNGDFKNGMDRWFFATDVDPPWHLHSLPVAVLFDQGWLGVLGWGAVLAVALVGGARLAWQGRALVPAALPALAGFLVSGSLNTLIDAPRFLWLVLVLAGLCTAARAAPPLSRAGPGVGSPAL